MYKQKPGPKSVADMAVQISAIAVKRPKAPAELSEDEKATWDAVTGNKPGDWWRADTFALLVGYCRHVKQAKHLDTLISWVAKEQLDDKELGFTDWLASYDKLLKARDRESRALVNLARAMRITQQAQMHPMTAGRKTSNSPAPHLAKPWEA